jgi:hypothetical protein
MKILAKIARRNNSNELPDRRELVEMDLFDTDRNPWPGQSGVGGLWKRYHYEVTTPFFPSKDANMSTPPLVGPVELVVDRASLAVAFVGAVFDVGGGAGDYKTLNLQLVAERDDGNYGIDASTEQTFLTNFPGYRTRDYNAYRVAVMAPGTYQVKFWCWKTYPDGSSIPAITVQELAATIALVPAGILGAIDQEFNT